MKVEEEKNVHKTRRQRQAHRIKHINPDTKKPRNTERRRKKGGKHTQIQRAKINKDFCRVERYSVRSAGS
jgi:hypothetical protein